MVVDVKDNTKMANSMVKVEIGSINNTFCVKHLFAFKIGMILLSTGDRIEGQFKDDKLNG